MTTKTCSDCKITKSIRRFPKNRNWCILCWRKRHREYQSSPGRSEYNRTNNLGWKARYVRCRRSAQLRGISFELTPEQYHELCDLPCVYCGWKVKDTGHGLDRKDSKGPYSVNNVVPSCGVCNWAKHVNFSYEEMLVLGKTISQIRASRSD